MRLLDVRGRGARGAVRDRGVGVNGARNARALNAHGVASKKAAEPNGEPNPGAPNAPLNSNPMHAPALDPEWCAEKASEALAWLAPPAIPRGGRLRGAARPPGRRPRRGRRRRRRESLPRGAAGLLPGGACRRARGPKGSGVNLAAGIAAHNARALDEILRKRWPGGEVLRGGALLLRNAKVAGPSGRPDNSSATNARPLFFGELHGPHWGRGDTSRKHAMGGRNG